MLNTLKVFGGKFATSLMLFFAFVLMAGCEAPLVLDKVNEQRKQPIQRTDRFQAAANNGSATVVVANQGVIVYSQDDGNSWQRHTFEGWPALIDVAACPNGSFVALAYDRTVYLSSDNGSSWQAKKIPTEETPQAITCAPNNDLWVVGSFTFMWVSRDQGDTWTESTRDEDSIFTTVQFVDDNTGFVMGEFGIAMKTVDGGENWENLPPLPNEFYSQAALFLSKDKGWVGGLGGAIFHTTDGGQTWTKQATNLQVPIYALTEINGDVYAAGGEGNLLRLADNEWLPLAHDKPLRLYIRALTAVGDNLLVGGVRGTLHLITPGGA